MAGGEVVIKHWDSITDLLNEAGTLSWGSSRASWTGGDSCESLAVKLRKGDLSLVDKAVKITDRIDGLNLPLLPRAETVRSPFGGRVNLSDWLSNSPTPMRRRVKRESDLTPLKIAVSIAASGGITALELENRGIAILALVMQVQKVRPVELSIFADMCSTKDGWVYPVVRIDSTPLDLSTAVVLLAHTGVFRHYFMGWCRDNVGYAGNWPTDYRKDNYDAKRRERLGMTKDDIVLDGVYLGDETSAVEWVKTQLTKLGMMTTEG